MDATNQLTMPSTFDLKGFLGYVLFVPDGPDRLRPFVEHNMQFRGEAEPIIVVPASDFPVGLLYWDNDVHLFRVVTIRPDEAHFR